MLELLFKYYFLLLSSAGDTNDFPLMENMIISD